MHKTHDEQKTGMERAVANIRFNKTVENETFTEINVTLRRITLGSANSGARKCDRLSSVVLLVGFVLINEILLHFAVRLHSAIWHNTHAWHTHTTAFKWIRYEKFSHDIESYETTKHHCNPTENGETVFLLNANAILLLLLPLLLLVSLFVHFNVLFHFLLAFTFFEHISKH